MPVVGSITPLIFCGVEPSTNDAGYPLAIAPGGGL
jgi:hypothetical protein